MTKAQELKENIEVVQRMVRAAHDDAPESGCAELTARAVLHLSNIVAELVRLERVRELVAEHK